MPDPSAESSSVAADPSSPSAAAQSEDDASPRAETSADEATASTTDTAASPPVAASTTNTAASPLAAASTTNAATSAEPTPPTAMDVRAGRSRLLLLSVMVVATCGLVYELISATMASYLLGDSVTQWSLVIGVYLSAMGLGSWLSKFVVSRLHTRFIHVQLVIALVGGYSATALFFGFARGGLIVVLIF